MLVELSFLKNNLSFTAKLEVINLGYLTTIDENLGNFEKSKELNLSLLSVLCT